ncbi:hypothetical protein [Sphingomonas sp. 3-13AW]|uniref:hypothetical protein n=1 Tax=Sphingomonas sp. 3-13AW TaxID=3050450 RepID=UPI003BB4ADEE
MSVIKSEATASSVVLPLSVLICRHSDGKRWQVGDPGTFIEFRVHLDAETADANQLMDGVVAVIRHALATTGEDLGDVAFIDVRYNGDFTRNCKFDGDDEHVGEDLYHVIDAFFYKAKLYFSPEYAERNNHEALTEHVRRAFQIGAVESA